jgi:hypothetical protein
MTTNIDSDTQLTLNKINDDECEYEDITLTVEYIDEADFPFAFSLLAKKYEDLLNGTLKNKKERFDPKLYYEKNKEKYVQYYTTRKNKIENVRVHCDICNCDYFENHKSKHKRTKKHINHELENLQHLIQQKIEQEKDINQQDKSIMNKLYLDTKASLKRIDSITKTL